MIEYRDGDLFESGAQALINTVNCKGAMGGGIALQFRRRYPEMYQQYKHACIAGQVKVGRMWVYEVANLFTPEKMRCSGAYDTVLALFRKQSNIVVNFPTKDDWRYPSRLSYIEDGLVDLVNVVRTRRVVSVACPMLGCGLGGLPWETVRPLLVAAFAEVPDVTVYLYGKAA